jgi:NAD-dependent dihydropyrimidine dehydrogenase PreA subunit
MKNIYEKLREKLDTMSVGFPDTPNQIEIKILKRLFSEEDAELFLNMSQVPETPEAVAERLKRDPEKLALQMEKMAMAGLLFRVRRTDSVKYTAIPYVVGIYEFQIDKIDTKMAKDMEDYFEEAFGKNMQSFKTPVLRTVPINESITVRWPVAPFEDVVQIINKQKKLAIAPCICRKISSLLGKGCDKPLETCFIFGTPADYYVENGMGRYVTKEEAIKIAKNNDEAGLVMQPFNSQTVGSMCSCCGCCCGVLRSLKMQNYPAKAVQSNYYVQVDPEMCASCETCIDRCQMDAIEMIDDIASVNLDRCIGCGLCVTTCSGEALSLMMKPEEEQYIPPKTGIRTYIQIEKERKSSN